MHCKGSRRRREKGPDKIFEDVIAENFPNMGKEIVNPSPGSTESSRHDKPKEEYIKTHSNQTDKNERQDEILKATREK